MADTRIDELRRRLERDPGSRLFAQLAEELRKGGELAEAIRVARAGLALHPSYPSARLTLGRALLDSGEATGARVELESALRDAPDNIQASRFLAQAREALGDLKGAVEQYRKTLQMAPGDHQLQGALAAVEARLTAPAGGKAVEAETTPPAPRRVPPPLPPSATGTAGTAATAARGTAARPAPATAGGPGAHRAGSPPVVLAPSRPTAPAAGQAAGDGAERSGELPATLRIRSSQPAAPEHPTPPPKLVVPPPPPPPPPPPRRPPEPGAPPVTGAVAVAAEAPTLPGSAGDTVGDWDSELPVAAAAASEATTPFSSSTLAELYFQQGLVDRAKDVYRQLLEQDPENAKAQARLAELERAAPAADERAARRRSLERTIAGLETLLAAVRRR